MAKTKYLLGQRIKEIRKNKNITQEKLADLIGIEKRNLSNIENGHTFPSRSLEKFPAALDVEMEELFDYEHIEKDLSYKKQFLCKAIDELSENNINILYRFVKAMR